MDIVRQDFVWKMCVNPSVPVNFAMPEPKKKKVLRKKKIVYAECQKPFSPQRAFGHFHVPETGHSAFGKN